MNATFWHSFFTIVLWIGLAFTAIGTIVSQHLSKKVEYQKEQQATKQD